MSSSKRPVSVLVLACLYLAVGVAGFVAHFGDLRQTDGVWIELTEFLAIVAGAFMLRAQNWARWLALAWMAFHVVLSFRAPPQLAIHALMLALIAWLLFRPEANRYFRSAAAA
ncbi:MAG TPA: hypothetical protein VK670_05570 [Silvibacterium sp.]|nr:hypothetical protein [Silvibacterium sp.]